jgi:hypothetical protein
LPQTQVFSFHQDSNVPWTGRIQFFAIDSANWIAKALGNLQLVRNGSKGSGHACSRVMKRTAPVLHRATWPFEHAPWRVRIVHD